MRWIKYQIVQNTVDEGNIFVTKKIGYSDENLVIAQAEAYNGEYTIEEDSTELGEPAPFITSVSGTGKIKTIKIVTNDITEGETEIPAGEVWIKL